MRRTPPRRRTSSRRLLAVDERVDFLVREEVDGAHRDGARQLEREADVEGRHAALGEERARRADQRARRALRGSRAGGKGM